MPGQVNSANADEALCSTLALTFLDDRCLEGAALSELVGGCTNRSAPIDSTPAHPNELPVTSCKKSARDNRG